ncbi:hypothetical protein ACJJTC_006514 [Scirpophaga incertulas]
MPKRSAPEKLERYERKIRKIQQQEESKPLGASTSESPDFGDAAHESLATLWHPILRKGLPKEEKEKLTKESLIPVKLVVPSLEKNIVHVIHDAERDETLFGNSLGEKIKTCKAIEKQGSQIRKTNIQNRSNAASQPSTSCPAQQGNWTGPPRYPSIMRSTETCLQGKSPQLPFDIVANSAEEF